MNRAKPSSSVRTAALAAFIVAALLSFSCVTEVVTVLPATAIVAPMNFDEVVGAQFTPGVKVSTVLLTKYLEHRGIHVVQPDFAEFQSAWAELLDGNKAPFSDTPEYASLMARMIERFSPNNEDAVIVVPHLVRRQAQLNGQRGRWDGTVRTVIVEIPEAQKDVFEGRFANTNADAVSLRVLIYGPNERVHEGYGGIDLTWKYKTKINITTRIYTPTYEPRLGEDIFGDPAVVARGVRVALDPYIPRK